MRWRCEECGELLGQVIRPASERRAAFCPYCHRVTYQVLASLPDYRKIKEREREKAHLLDC
ncbi:hypothetical protein ES708_10564 [subsurface metagenome]